MDSELYDSIYKRKSFHLFREIGNKKITLDEKSNIEKRYKEFSPLYSNIKTKIKIVTAIGFAKYNSLSSLLPMGWAMFTTFIVYLIWDIVWIVLVSKNKIPNDKSTNVMKYIVILLQVFTFACLYLGMAIGSLY